MAHIDPDPPRGHDKDATERRLARDLERLASLQEMLYAERKHAVLVVLQGIDTSGKDGTIKHVISAMNPNGCTVVPFKVPTEEEAAHDFLWRIHQKTPRRGQVTIFNRSHYEDVIVPLVHRVLPRTTVQARYDHINAFERVLQESGTLIIKFFLHISKKEQRERLHARIDDPAKRWKFNIQDIHERKLWPRYRDAYDTLLTRCSTRAAPWYVIPADKKWYSNAAVAEILVQAFEGLGGRYPPLAVPLTELRRLRF